MAGPQSEEDCLLVPLELVDWISTIFCTRPSLPLGPVLVVDASLGLPVSNKVTEMLFYAACLGCLQFHNETVPIGA